MENYIVRIYRRDADDPEKVTGMLESVEYETRQSFHSINALQALLTPQSDSCLHNSIQPDGRKPAHITSVALLK